MTPPRFEILFGMFGDAPTHEIFTERRLIESWLDVEVALAAAQAELGMIEQPVADAIAKAASFENIDREALWADARTVGYPILPLVRQIDEGLATEHQGRVHFGATTQDIMDSGLALQLQAAADRLDALLIQLGDRFATLARDHASTVTAARTHAQQAVPTVLGAKFAVYLAEITRHRGRLSAALHDVAVISLFGAGGTSAGYGPGARELRAKVADRLGLRTVDVPWHVARDSISAFAMAAAAMTATAARFAHEVIDLSRTEISELAEAPGHLRGASSTMPQKTNPVESEAVIGLAATSEALCSAMFRSMEAGHDRSAGEWQIEWQVLPQVICLAGAALRTVLAIAEGLQVFPDQMRKNLRTDGGLIMAEAYMMRLAQGLGREAAHELVYEAARLSRQTGRAFIDVLRELAPASARSDLREELLADGYLGDTALTIKAAVEGWQALQ